MTQPSHDCTGQIVLPDLGTTKPDPGIPAAWMILALVVAVAIFELWALKTKRNTISHLMQRISRGRRWFRWLAVAGMSVLTWHLVWGFPW